MRWNVVLATLLLALVLCAIGLNLNPEPEALTAPEVSDNAPIEFVPTVAPPPLTETLALEKEVAEDWLLRGRVRFAGFPYDPRELPVLAARLDRFILGISTVQVGADHPRWEVDLDRSGSFRFAIASQDLAVSPDIAMWEVACSQDPLSGDGLTAALSVRAKVEGRTVDFGEITITAEMVFDACHAATGRLIHSSGVSFSNSGPYLLGYTVTDDSDLCTCEEFAVNDLGEFFTTFRSAPPDDEVQWFLILSEDAELDADSVGRISIDPPESAAGFLNFGELVAAGPLLQITSAAEGVEVLSTPRGSVRRDIRGDYRGDSVSLKMSREDERMDVPAYPGLVVRQWVTPGRWTWQARVHAPGYHSDRFGAVHAMEDRVYPLHLEFTRFSEIPYTVIGNDDPLPLGAVTWRVTDDGKEIASGEARQGTVPVHPVAVTHVLVSHEGYEPGVAEATASMQSLTIELLPLAMIGTTLTVSVPAQPAGAVLLDVDLIAAPADGGERASLDVKLGKERKEYVFHASMLHSPGVWNVYLRGGGRYGYPISGLSGPVAVEIKTGEAASLELPDIGAPPWKHSARWMNTWMECEGVLFMWTGPQKYGEGGVHDNSPYGWLPTALPDGDEFAEAKVTLPQKDGDNAHALFDLEARVKVSITVRGKPAKAGYWLTLVSETRYGRGTVECPAIGKWTSMWAPEGEATLTVEAQSGAFNEPVFEKKLSIRRGHAEHIEIDLDHVEVVFEGGYFTDKRAHLRDDPNWGVLRVDVEKPYLVECFSGEEGREEEVALLPGIYRVVPLTSDPNNYVEFDVTDGLGRTITLPTLGPLKLGTCELLFDTALLGIGEVKVDLHWRPACDMPAVRELRLPMDDVKAEPGPRGLIVSGVPTGVDVFLCGTIRIETRQGKKALMLNPVRLHQGESEIEVGWTKTRRLSERVLTYWIGIVSMVEGQWLPFRYDYNYVPVGTHQVALLDRNNRPAGRMQVEVPDAPGDFEVPEDFRRELIRLGLLRDGTD